jgi:glycosyltransferase involved in cell wall biosynthesis
MFGWENRPFYSGGLGKVCGDLAETLAGKGVEVLFFMPKTAATVRKTESSVIDTNDLKINDSDCLKNRMIAKTAIDTLISPYMNSNSYYEAYSRRIGVNAKTDLYGHDIYREVLRYAENAHAISKITQYDLVHAHDWMSIPAGIAARDTRNVSFVIHIHSLESDRSAWRIDEKIYGIEKFGMIEADHIIAVSEYTKKKIIDQYGIAPEKISVIYNGASVSEPGTPVRKRKNKKNVLFIGRLTEQKGPCYFIEAASKVIAADSDVRFFIAGDGELAGELKKKVSRLDMDEYVFFTGFIDETEKLYAMCDLYVMTSVSEPFGMTAIEAVNSGVPVIISKTSGVAEVLKRAPKIDFRDTDALAFQILKILHDDEIRDLIVNECREDINVLTWEKAAHEIVEVYNRCLEADGYSVSH